MHSMHYLTPMQDESKMCQVNLCDLWSRGGLPLQRVLRRSHPWLSVLQVLHARQRVQMPPVLQTSCSWLQMF